MPTLELVPKKATLHIQAGDPGTFAMVAQREPSFEPTFTRSVIYSVVPAHIVERVRLTTGEKFSDLDGQITLRESETQNTNDAVGILVYFPEYENRSDLDYMPPSFEAHCTVLVQQLDELVLAARQGRMPRSISVDVVGEGAKLGWQPDGSGFDWNNKDHPRVPIGEIRFRLPLVSAMDVDDFDEDDETVKSMAPVSHVQIERLIQKVEALQSHVKLILFAVVIVASLLVARFEWWN